MKLSGFVLRSKVECGFSPADKYAHTIFQYSLPSNSDIVLIAIDYDDIINVYSVRNGLIQESPWMASRADTKWDYVREFAAVCLNNLLRKAK